MRKTLLAAAAGALLAGSGWAQGPAAPATPPVRIGSPVPAGPEFAPSTPLPPPQSAEPPPAVEGLGLPGVVVSPPGGVIPPSNVLPGVRPPAPVAGPPEEIPPGPRVWVTAEYLLWRSKGGLLPALITDVVGPTPYPLAAYPLSDDRINGALQSGVRLTAGYWLDKPFGTGVEGRFIDFFGQDGTNLYAGPPARFLSRPFWDALGNRPALFQLSTPDGVTRGAAEVRTGFDSWGLEANMLRRGPAMIGNEFHWVLGARYWTLGEDLTVAGGSQTGALRAGSFDSFTTRNQFFGPQVGGRWHWIRNGLDINLGLTFAGGVMHQDVNVQGGSVAVLPSGARVDRPGGFLALVSNSGDHTRNKFAMLRDLSLGVGYCLTDHVTLRLGYDLLWVSGVVRPGEQADLLINPTLLPFSGVGPTAPLKPGFRFNDETFWMHGITLGVTVQF